MKLKYRLNDTVFLIIEIIIVGLILLIFIMPASALIYEYDKPGFVAHDPYEEGQNMITCGHMPSFVTEDYLTVFTSLDIKELEISPININTWALVNYTAPNGYVKQYNLSKAGFYWNAGRYPIHLIMNENYQIGRYEVVDGLDKCMLVVDKPLNYTAGHYKGQTSQGQEIEFDVFDEEVDYIFFLIYPTCQGKGHGFGLSSMWFRNSFVFSYNYVLNWTMKPVRIIPKENFAVYGTGRFVNSTYVKGSIKYVSAYFTGDKDDMLKTSGCQKSYSYYAEWVGNVSMSEKVIKDDIVTISRNKNE